MNIVIACQIQAYCFICGLICDALKDHAVLNIWHYDINLNDLHFELWELKGFTEWMSMKLS